MPHVDWDTEIENTRRRAEIPPKENLHRVSSRIAPIVYNYCKTRVGTTFRMEELHNHVNACMEFADKYVAPDSASRILRMLRASGDVSYELLSRRGSLYRVVSVRPKQLRLV